MTISIMKFRKAASLTQKHLADRLGVTQSAVSSWERGKKQPNLTKLPDLARALGCTVDELFKDHQQGADR